MIFERNRRKVSRRSGEKLSALSFFSILFLSIFLLCPAVQAAPLYLPSTTHESGISPTPPPPTAFTLTSSAYNDGGSIPDKYTYTYTAQCSGPNYSPPLSWSGTPAGTQSFAIIMEDTDAADFTHWLQYNIPGNEIALSEAVGGPNIGVKLITDFLTPGYAGPCPPSGTHQYVITLYALDTTLPGSLVTKSQLKTAMQGHTLGTAQLTGLRSK